jgi:hypothetical protein
VTVETIDGTRFEGQWEGCADGGRVVIQRDGESREIDADELAAIEFAHSPKSATGSTIFHLADGGWLHGELASVSGPDTDIGSADESSRTSRHYTVLACTALGDRVGFPFNRLTAVQLASAKDFAIADEIFRGVLEKRLPGQDVLITREVAEPKGFRGRLDALTEKSCTFFIGDRPRPIVPSRIYAVVMAAGATAEPKYPVTLTLRDGSTFSGRLLPADGNSGNADSPATGGGSDSILRVATSLSHEVTLPVSDLSQIQLHSERVVYLSDVTSVEERIEGRLHPAWPIRTDRNVAGGPLSLGGRTYAKGLGVHSRTEVVYALDGKYEKFAATVGVDDAVRPRGSLVFRVLGSRPEGGDPAVLFDSREVTGRDDPRTIVVDVNGLNRMTLVVDFGEDLDLSDYANWAGARLLKPAAGASRKPAGVRSLGLPSKSDAREESP